MLFSRFSVVVERLAFMLAVATILVTSHVTAHAENPTDSKMRDDADHRRAAILFSGADISQEGYFLYKGVLVPLNGYGQDGVVLRAFAGYGNYDSGGSESTIRMGDLSIGYQRFARNLRIAAFVGLDYQNIDLDPDDPTSLVEGVETGAKFIAEVETVNATSVYASFIGDYSTANDTYWARARVGRNFGRLTVGPEGIVLGNEEFDAQRIGAFVNFELNIVPESPLYVSASGGYNFSDDTGVTGSTGDGGYGAVSFGYSF